MTAFANLPRMQTAFRSGSEQLHLSGEVAGPELLGYWRWSSSQLLDNAQRGVFAEYLVCVALGV